MSRKGEEEYEEFLRIEAENIQRKKDKKRKLKEEACRRRIRAIKLILNKNRYHNKLNGGSVFHI
jgi:hypothetical protein